MIGNLYKKEWETADESGKLKATGEDEMKLIKGKAFHAQPDLIDRQV
jgi:hypothetical protein